MIVCFVILILLILTAVTFAVSVRADVGAGMGSHVLRVVIFVGLCVFLYRGHEWASMTLAFASAYGGLTGLFSIMKTYENGSWSQLALVTSMVVAYYAVAVLLILTPSVKAFLKHQLPPKSD